MRNIICPVCSQGLTVNESGKSAICSQGHLFDFSKYGYLNLLLSQQKKSKSPGDTNEMVAARRDFLNEGYYEGLADKFISLATRKLSSPSSPSPHSKVASQELNYLDIACGEGYYTERLHQTLTKSFEVNGVKVTTTGLDISTPAIKAATKRSKEIQWLISTAANIPVAPASQDLASSLFCRVDFEQAALVLKPGGAFIVARTGNTHLLELREVLYSSLREENTAHEPVEQHTLALLDTITYSQQTTVNSQELLFKLLQMTPHYWRATEEAKLELKNLSRLTLTLHVEFDIYQKQEN